MRQTTRVRWWRNIPSVMHGPQVLMHAWRARVGALGMVMLLAGCAADNASMNRTQGGVPDLRCDYGAPCGKTPGAPAEGSISR